MIDERAPVENEKAITPINIVTIPRILSFVSVAEMMSEGSWSIVSRGGLVLLLSLTLSLSLLLSLSWSLLQK